MAGADRAFLLLPARGTRQPPGTGSRGRGRLAATPARRRTGDEMIPENPEHRTEAVVATHLYAQERPLDHFAADVHADALDDAGAHQESTDMRRHAVMLRYIADPSERHRDLFVAEHGGNVSRAAFQLSTHAYDRTHHHHDARALQPGTGYEAQNAWSAARDAHHATDAYHTSADIRSNYHSRAASHHADERFDIMHRPEQTDAGVELSTIHYALHQLHRHALAALRGDG